MTACWFAGSLRVWPWGASKTTWAVAPSVVASGLRASMSAKASVDSTPSRSKLSLVWPDNVVAPTPPRTSRPTQTRATILRWRKDQRPSRNRCHAMGGPFEEPVRGQSDDRR